MKHLLFRNDHLCIQQIVLSSIVIAIMIGEIAAANFQPDAMTFTEAARDYSEANTELSDLARCQRQLLV